MLGIKDPGDLRFFDEKQIPEDVWRVARTASLLSVGEFRVFELAYRQWFGEPATEAAIERFFIPYMFHDRVPTWVRHYCTQVIDQYRDGSFEPEAFGVKFAEATREQQWRGFEYMLWIVSAMIMMFILADATAQLLRAKCVLPPCY